MNFLNTPYVPKNEPCALCQGTGYVLREMTFRACLCPLGRECAGKPWGWDGYVIDPQDYPKR